MVDGATAIDILKSEQPVAHMSGGDTPFVVVGKLPENPNDPQVQVLTEAAIYKAVLNMLETAKANDQIDLAMFYLSERKIIKELLAAKQRGAKLRILLDPNKDAFGRQRMVFQIVRWLQNYMMRVSMCVGVIRKVSSAIAK